METAGDALFQTQDPEDLKHEPTRYLIDRAYRIQDKALQDKVIDNIRELWKRYEGIAQEYKASNGKDSLLLEALGEEKGKEAWYAVRTALLKKWFGDWERAARIADFENSPNIILKENAYQGIYKLNKESIYKYLKNTLREELNKNPMSNPNIDGDIRLSGNGIDKLIGWGMANDVYKKLFAHIPELTKNAILLSVENKNGPSHHIINTHILPVA